MTPEMKHRVARNLVSLRKITELTQTNLAKKVIICRSTYAQYEQGDRLPDLDTLHALAEFYHIQVDAILNCDMNAVLSDHFMNRRSTNEAALLRIYSRLSDVSKGKLLERADMLLRIDNVERQSSMLSVSNL